MGKRKRKHKSLKLPIEDVGSFLKHKVVEVIEVREKKDEEREERDEFLYRAFTDNPDRVIITETKDVKPDGSVSISRRRKMIAKPYKEQENDMVRQIRKLRHDIYFKEFYRKFEDLVLSHSMRGLE